MEENIKLAALDIGTNSFHLIVVSVLPNGNFEIIDREKEVIRLSEGNVGDIKIIQPHSIERAIKAIERFITIAKSHNAKLRATATSAVRESINKTEFIQEVLKKTGLQIEIISGLEEARLIYLGILKAVPIYNHKSLCIDIGGGSTEFILGNKGIIEYSNSLKLGAVRLTQRFFPNYILKDENVILAKKWVEGVLAPIKNGLAGKEIEYFVGSSGTIMNVGMMIQAEGIDRNKENPIFNNFEFTAEELFEVERKILKCITPDDRKTIPGLEEKRIDIIPAGVIIIATIFRVLKIKKMIISDYALREGVILDSMDKLGICEDGNKLHNIRFESIKQLADSSKYDSVHCYNVAKLSVQIFDQIVELHKLDENAREYLEAASILHDIGYHISHSQHHKHSYYIIRNSFIRNVKVVESEHLFDFANSENSRIAVRNDWPELITIINKGMAAISGEQLQELSERWLIADGQEEQVGLSDEEKKWLAEAKKFAPICYGLGTWGPRTAGEASKWEKFPACVHQFTKICFFPVGAQDFRAKSCIFWEAANTLSYRSYWQAAIKGNADWVQVITWNDYSEATEISPSSGTQYSLYDLTAYYITWFKTGKKPEITRDVLYYSHRIHSVHAKPDLTKQKKMFKPITKEPLRDDIELLCFLKAPGTVTISIGNKKYTKEFKSGVNEFRVPLQDGIPEFTLRRDGKQIINFKSKFPINSKNIVYQDLLYRGGSSSRAK